MTAGDARRLFDEALAAATARDTARSVQLTRQALAADPSFPEALEHLAMLLVTRQRNYGDGLASIERAAECRPDDAGLWYAAGWLYEFAAHETRRTAGAGRAPDVRPWYERAAACFRRCLELNPEGKLQGDAEDLLDHVENQIAAL